VLTAAQDGARHEEKEARMLGKMRRRPAMRGHWSGRLLVATVLAVAMLGALIASRDAGSASGAGQVRVVTGAQALDTLAGSGLALTDVHQQRVEGSPSSAPATESAAWSFSVAGVGPGSVRLMEFADEAALRRKLAWFERAGVPVTRHRNLLLWIDPAVDPSVAAGLRRALLEVR
jgi:hypothetical protein